jgi:hypothetical protein
MIKKCTICGEPFNVKPSRHESAKTCGNACKAIRMKGNGNHQHGLRGSLNASFRGGKRVDSKGYVRVLMPDHPNADAQGYVKEHILVMSQILGRPLNTDVEMVHHKDENKINNDPSNLELMTKSRHTSLHNSQRVMARDEEGRFIRRIR